MLILKGDVGHCILIIPLLLESDQDDFAVPLNVGPPVMVTIAASG